MRRGILGTAFLFAGGLCLFAEILWVSSPAEEHFGLPPLAARALVFTVGLTGFVLLYAGFRTLRSR